MPNAIQLDDLINVQAWIVNAEQAAVNNFWFTCTNPGNGACTAVMVADDVDTIMAPLYKASLGVNSNYQGIRAAIAYRLSVLFNEQWSEETIDAGPGTVAGTQLPRQSAGLSSWQTSFRGRHYRGRTYWPFPPTAFDTGDGLPTAAAITAYEALAAGILSYQLNVATGAIFALAVFSRPRIFPPPKPPQVYQTTLIQSHSTALKWATQRRRGSFGRANVSPI